MAGEKYDREFLINRIVMMRIKGKSTRFLLDFLQHDIGMPLSTAYTVVRDAQEVILTMQEKSIEEAYADAIARLEELYDEESDKKNRLSIQQELNKLQGLYKPSKVDITSNGESVLKEVNINIIKNNEQS